MPDLMARLDAPLRPRAWQPGADAGTKSGTPDDRGRQGEVHDLALWKDRL